MTELKTRAGLYGTLRQSSSVEGMGGGISSYGTSRAEFKHDYVSVSLILSLPKASA